MNKKDFWILMLCNIISAILLVECFCGLEAAIWCLCGWSIISAATHICVLKDYAITYSFVQKDYTK